MFPLTVLFNFPFENPESEANLFAQAFWRWTF